MNQLVKLTFAFSTFVVVHNAIASVTVDKTKHSQISQKFIQIQIDQNVTIGRAIKTMVEHYPQKAASIVYISLDLYPLMFIVIIHAAFSSKPTFSDEVVTISLDIKLSCFASIVETAINSDPCYIDFVFTASARSTLVQFSVMLLLS